MSANPSTVAREAIRQLAARRLPPTPDNYSRLYDELSGTESAPHPSNRALEAFANVIAARKGGASRVAELRRALAARDWDTVTTLVTRLARRTDAETDGESGPDWAECVRTLLRQWERRLEGITQARKRESLEHVLGAYAGESHKLHARLTGLVGAWSVRPDAPARVDSGAGAVEATRAVVLAAAPAESTGMLVSARELVAQTIEYAVVARLGHSPQLQDDARNLALRARACANAGELEGFAGRLRQYFLRLELAGEDIDELLRGLLGLLRLLTDNVADLVGEDRWVAGQVAVVQALLAEPLGREQLREAERGFRELIFKQSTRKIGLDQAKVALKDMVSLFVDRLASVGASTDAFQVRMGEYAERIEQTDDLAGLGALVGELVAHTRGMQADVRKAHEELEQARQLASAHEARIRSLELELEQVSGKVREDALTGTLNRRGLDECWTIESARAARLDAPLCLAVIDLDNFKALNDRLGHQAGDHALVHLTKVMRLGLRPSDVVARYGGEEFVIVLPHTPVDEAVAVVTRLQRELTRRFFLHNNERVLVTFSGGVTLWRPGEARDQTMERADKALYEAKRTGKNRVIASP